MSIGTRIKALRLQAGLTQVQLAQASGILQSVLTHYENDRKIPLAPRLAAIAKALGTTVEEILDEPAQPFAEPKPHVHGNSLAAKIQPLFIQLRPEQQKAIYHQVQALLRQHETAGPNKRPREAA